MRSGAIPLPYLHAECAAGLDHASFVWHLGGLSLDVEAMNQAAARFVGEHDFKSFCMAASAHIIEADGRSTCRNVVTCGVYEEVLAGTPVMHGARSRQCVFCIPWFVRWWGTLVESGQRQAFRRLD